jgi:hypothetical protein
MSFDEAGRRRAILVAFRRRRARAIIAAIPVGAALLVIGLSQEDPELQVLGLRGRGLVAGAIGVVILCALYQLVAWRCPVCGRSFTRGLAVGSCDRCGTVFSERWVAQATPAVPPSPEQEEAVRVAVERYRARTTRISRLGIVPLASGLVLMGIASFGEPRPSWPALGLLAAGLVLVVDAAWRARVGVYRRAEQVRRSVFRHPG